MKIKFIPFLFFSILALTDIAGQTDTYTVRPGRFNSKNNDEFSPVFYNNGLVFCSNRNYNLFRNYQNSDNRNLLKINFVDTVSWKVRLFSRSLSTRYNDGPASFIRNGDTIYFSRNLKVDGTVEQELSPRNKLGIFTAIYENDDWIKILDVRFNNEYYNITTPFISPDGKRLFFSSDNPAGFGGTDIYYCNWTGDYWDEPVNLGPGINTPGNESYPSVNREGGLFFSSDGHPGLGGKDIFYTKEKNHKWLPPVHLDTPVNSKFDEFGLIADSVMGSGYFSTKRSNSVDIYEFKTNIYQLFYCDKQRVNQYCFKFSDEGKLPVDTRYVQLVWTFGDGSTATGQTVEHCFAGPGRYPVSLDMTDKKNGKVFFSKLAYYLVLKDVEQPIILSPSSAMVGQPVSLNGLSSNFPGYDILSYTWYFGDDTRATGEKLNHVYDEKGNYDVNLGLMVRNRKTGVIKQACSTKQIRIFSDKNEKASFDGKPVAPPSLVSVFEYDHATTESLISSEKVLTADGVFRLELVRSKRRLASTDAMFSNIPDKFKLVEEFIPDERIYSYTILEEMSIMDLYPSYMEISGLGYDNARAIVHNLTDAASKELYNLKRVFGTSSDTYFVPGSVVLTNSGKQTLDLILGYLSKYQGVKLEISCHTDNQGTAESNQSLTQKRAEAMVNYLLINGISRQRIIPKGYGSSRYIAPNYQESDRKRNRRVDFRIIENKPVN